MRSARDSFRWALAGLALFAAAGAAGLGAADRFRVEFYGGLALMNPRDLNLFAQAEEQYNYILFQERLLGYDGYFTNDFPEVWNALPAGLRLRYGLGRKFDVSVEFEAYRAASETRVSGTFSYSPDWALTESKAYDPFRVGLKSMSIMAGFHYRFKTGGTTELEVGGAVGWAWAEFTFLSSWTAALDLTEDGEVISSSVDGATLEGAGKGDAPTAKLMLRLNRALGRRWGFFVETAAVYCRMSSLSGGGRETVLGVPGETVWEGTWAIKREEIVMPYDSATVLVPSNYWAGWTAGQFERDFHLDISGLRLMAGIYLKF